ncbi:MAG TPA: dihydrofolate reductase family protein [Anaerolineales bacterium]|nr:dihydrofolate reductase family protein [Anaerolineales bacterium]
MRKVLFFMMTSLDGYFEGTDREIDWHNVGDEFNEFAIGQLNEVDTLLFGRRTYELMASYWPTKDAQQDDPFVAARMNSLPKIVFSRALPRADWQNTTVVRAGFAAEVTKLKQQPGKDLIIFGSSDLAVTFLQYGLLDECRIMINPVVLGHGKPLFKGFNDRLRLKLLRVRAFHSGNVLLCYEPVVK